LVPCGLSSRIRFDRFKGDEERAALANYDNAPLFGPFYYRCGGFESQHLCRFFEREKKLFCHNALLLMFRNHTPEQSLEQLEREPLATRQQRALTVLVSQSIDDARHVGAAGVGVPLHRNSPGATTISTSSTRNNTISAINSVRITIPFPMR
jgi:hypothetical protein